METARLVGLRALRNHLSRRFGPVDRDRLLELVESGALPSVVLGDGVRAFAVEAVEQAIAELARRGNGGAR